MTTRGAKPDTSVSLRRKCGALPEPVAADWVNHAAPALSAARSPTKETQRAAIHGATEHGTKRLNIAPSALGEAKVSEGAGLKPAG